MMMTSDPIADMLTRIRNANTAKHDTVDIPASKIKVAIASVLGGLGIAILSTNQGIVTDKEARKLQVGGEVLAFVW